MRMGLLLVSAIATSGCSSPGKRPPWGSEATYTPGWSRLAQVTKRAATDPHVWVPLLGAGLFLVGNADEATSEWAVEESPIFGGTENAGETGEALLGVTVAASLGTILAAPGGEAKDEILHDKPKGLLITLAATGLNDRITDVIKGAVERDRPLGFGGQSFPSAHASAASISATLAKHNLEYYELSDTARYWLGASLYSVAGLAGWARVEGARHYPSDVLFGYALGHFLGVIANEAFIAPISDDAVSVKLSGDQQQVRLGLALSFQ